MLPTISLESVFGFVFCLRGKTFKSSAKKWLVGHVGTQPLNHMAPDGVMHRGQGACFVICLLKAMFVSPMFLVASGFFCC